jgi:glycosyltransferase involved in cell wall biosynthesis
MSMDIALVHAGAHARGGVSVDVEALAGGLRKRGNEALVLSSARDLVRALRRRPHAIVHVFGCLPSSTTFAAMATAKGARRPLVWTPVFHPSRRRSWKGYGWLRVMEGFDAVAPRAARFADAVLAATDAEAEFFRSLGSRRVELIPPGVARYAVADDEQVEAFRARMGLNGGPVVLTVARDNSRKALPFGVSAFRSLRQRRANAALLLVGANPGRWRDEPGVHCPGWLEPSDVELAYRVADVLFVPSLYEGLPRAVIEAWNFGVPVVATDRVALAPTIEDVGGLVVRYGRADRAAEALAAVLQDGELAHHYGENGRRIVQQRFALDRSIVRTEALYQEVMR